MRTYSFRLVLVLGLLITAALAAEAVTVPEYGPVVPDTGTVWNIYLAPLAISELNFNHPDPWENLQYGVAHTLKYDMWQDYDGLLGLGDFGLFDIAQTNSDSGIRDGLSFQSDPVSLTTGDYRDAHIGSKAGLLSQGINDRLTHSDNQTPTTTSYQDGQFDQWVADECPLDSRLMIAPVIRDESVINGQKQREIVGFAAFYVDWYGTLEGTKAMTVMFTSMPENPPVPEPSSLLALLGCIGGGGLLMWRRRS